MRRAFLSLLLFLLFFMPNVWAQPSANLQVIEGYQVTPEGAWCWFADPRALHHENEKKNINKTYIGYIDVHGNIKGMQYDFVRKQQVEVLIRSWFQPDDHNNPTFLVLPDDRVMVFYSRHTDESCFYYRISRVPGDITTLGDEKVMKTDHNTTYPSAFILSDDPKHIYLCWRGIKWHPTIAKLSLPDNNDNVEFVWGPHQLVQSTGARPYAKYMSNGKDRIYLTYTTGHPDNEHPNCVYFNALNIKTLQLEDVQGNILSKVEAGTFQVNKSASYLEKYPNTVVDSPSERDWIWQVAADRKGNPVIALVRISVDKKTHDYYYVKWTGLEWKKTFLSHAGGHFHQTPNLEMCYSAGMAIDPDDPNVIYCSLPVAGKNGTVYELVKYTLDDQANIVSTMFITQHSKKNNVRPYVIPGSRNSDLRLTWMHGEYYDWIVSSSRAGYPTAIHADFEGFSESADLHKGLTHKNQTFRGQLGETFTVSTVVDIDTANYSGSLLKIGDLSYYLNGETGKPELRYKGKVYPSTNVLGTADTWRKVSRGTDGKWLHPEKLQQLNLTLTYAKGRLQTYINGLLDQTRDLEKIKSDPINILSPNQQLLDVNVYNRVLNWPEINHLYRELTE